MKLSDIKVVEKGSKKCVFIDGVEQENVAKIETEVLPSEVTTVRISYYTDKFEIVREKELIEFDKYGCPTEREEIK